MRLPILLLLGSRARLLQSRDLIPLCTLAPRARAMCAVTCVGAFLFMVAVVLGFRLMPFEWVPRLVGGGFGIFLASALLAYRFGRLCSAEIGQSDRTAIDHCRRTSPAADAFYREVKGQGRPFTRVDLIEMRRRARAPAEPGK